MNILCRNDVDKFLDKFQDPTAEIPLILAMLEEMCIQLPLHKYTDDILEIKKYFINSLREYI